MFLAWIKYLRSRKHQQFMIEVTTSLGKLDRRDRDLLCRALSVTADADGLMSITNMKRKQLASRCNLYYTQLKGNHWDVYDAFCKVIRNARKGK